MTFVNRVSAFFLIALAVALAGYSAAFYLFARSYLYEKFDAQLENALEILSASVEIEPDDAKWHPAEHGIELEQDALSDVHWVVTEEQGQVIDHSRRVSRNDPSDKPVLDFAREEHPQQIGAVGIGDWRVLQRTLAAPAPKAVALRDPHEYARVTITVAMSQADLHATLGRLALLVCVLPTIVWLLAATAGRWFVGKAIAPVGAMAARARSSRQADFTLRLPVDESRDELAELGGAFNQLLDQLQQAFERQRRFTIAAAHQLRTPLTVLQGQIDVALRRPRTAEDYRATLTTLSDETTEFREILETLLFLARSEDDAQFPNFALLDLTKWLHDYAARWRGHARSEDVSLIAETGLRVVASGALLSQLLDNLVNNAIKYSASGTPVIIRSTKDRSTVAISVEDRGTGISGEDQGAIFEPFYRAPEARQNGIAGTGLGLAIAARIAKALHGDLKCASKPGEGSTFIFTLPASEAAISNGSERSAEGSTSSRDRSAPSSRPST